MRLIQLSLFLMHLVGPIWAHSQTCSEVFIKAYAPHRLVGRERIDPSNPLLRYYVEQIRALKGWRNYPQVHPFQLKSIEQISTSGNGNGGFLKAKLLERDVAVKLLDPQGRSHEAGMLREARVLMELNKLRHGVEFFGLVRFPDGRQGMVIEFIEGSTVSLHRETHQSAVQETAVSQRTFEDIVKTGNALAYLGYKTTADMQYMINQEGRAFLIDPEFFYRRVNYDHPLANSNFPSTPQASARHIVEGLYLYNQ